MIQRAKRIGVKPAARLFACAPNTIRKWCNRFDGSLASLEELSRAPRRRPRKLKPFQENHILQAKRKLPTWGAARLKRDMELPYSEKAIRRVLKEHGLTRKYRRKKHQTKRCLREIKRNWRVWQQITVDTKNLKDLPEYILQARRLGLPTQQYTARDVTSGALFLGFADELSITYSELFIKSILRHLEEHGADMKRLTIQTDNGSEFIGSWQAIGASAFTRAIEAAGGAHRRIPPGQYRYQADVETVHSLMENEFYFERFTGREDFLAKAATYQHYFNYCRCNSGKEYKCPFTLIREKNLKAPISLLYLPPVFLEDRLHKNLYHTGEVHDVWTHPFSCRKSWRRRRPRRPENAETMSGALPKKRGNYLTPGALS